VRKKVKIKTKLTEIGYIWGVVDETDLIDLTSGKIFINEKYDFILNSLNIGVWDWDIDKDEVILNETSDEILGLETKQAGISFEEIAYVVHPDDVDRVNDELKKVISTPSLEFESTHRIKLNDGTTKHIQVISKTKRNEDGIANRMLGMFWDVTKEKEIEEEKKKLAEQHSLLLESLEVGIWDWNCKSIEPEWNDVMYRLYDIPVTSEGLLEIFQTRLHPDDVDRVNNELEHVINTPGEEFLSEFRILLRDGTIRYIKSFSKTYRDDDGIATRIAGLNLDVSNEVKRKEKN
ncbi:MAG: PAS domain-containing protein, partial [Candidatus Kapaibacterium sp.]